MPATNIPLELHSRNVCSRFVLQLSNSSLLIQLGRQPLSRGPFYYFLIWVMLKSVGRFEKARMITPIIKQSSAIVTNTARELAVCGSRFCGWVIATESDCGCITSATGTSASFGVTATT